MNLHEYEENIDCLNGDQNSYSDDSESDEQKMLELEAMLYSKIHYAEDLSSLHEVYVSNTEKISSSKHRTSKKCENISNPADSEVKGVSSLEDETHVEASLFNEILKLKETAKAQNPQINGHSDSGMSSCEDEIAQVRSDKKSNNSTSPKLERLDTLDSKYTASTSKVRSKTVNREKANAECINDKDDLVVDSSETETSSDEDSGIQLIKHVDVNKKVHPMVDLESDDSCDDLDHTRFLEGIKDMDIIHDNTKSMIELTSEDVDSSDSEVELLLDTADTFSSTKESNACKKLRTNIIVDKSAGNEKEKPNKHSKSDINQTKAKVTIIDEKQSTKLPPKNIVNALDTSDSSSDDDNILGNTSLSLNVIGDKSRTNFKSLASCQRSFEQITHQEIKSCNGTVEQPPIDISHQDVLIRNWTEEMYTFYNEINMEDGNI